MTDTVHHICFVSDQNVAELLGALQPGGQASIHVHAIATPKMAAKAANFAKACKRNGIECSLYGLPVVGIAEIGKLLDSIRAENLNEAWAVNITGGTKLMSIGAYSWATVNNVAAFYIDTASQVINFYARGHWRKLRLPDLLKYEALLNLYGYEIERSASKPASFSQSATNSLLALLAQKDGVAAFHALNDRAIAASSDPALSTSYKEEKYFAELLAICKEAGKLDYTNSQITFRDDACRKWCNGIWLEEYVQVILAGLEAEKRITSHAANIRVIGEGYANELDAIFTVHNRLHIIECKTSRLASKGGATSILYKSDSLNDRIGGIYTRSLLCSLDNLTEPENRRARHMGIKTVAGAELKNLREILVEWIQTA